MNEFIAFPKIARLSREIVVTEKIDGTNAQIMITKDGQFLTGSRTRWITPEEDNYGFSAWAHTNRDELMQLGPGQHFGEWYGRKIQHSYGLTERRFALFDTHRWSEARPACCAVVPVLYKGMFSEKAITDALESLRTEGSRVVPGFMKPEGVIIYHTAGKLYFKKTLHKDEEWGGKPA